MFPCSQEMKWQRCGGSAWSGNPSRSMFQYPIICVEAGASRDGFFCNYHILLRPPPNFGRPVLHISALSCICSHLSSPACSTSPLFPNTRPPPPRTNHSQMCMIIRSMEVSLGFSLLTSYVTGRLPANMELGVQLL